MHKNEVNVAFELLLREMEGVFNILSKEGEEAFRLQDFEKARQLIENGERIRSFMEKVKALQKEWQTIFSGKIKTHIKRRKTKGKLKRGLRTSEEKFIIPILEAIIELGGSAKMKDVLNLVHDKMENILNKYDYESLPSNPRKKRWENTAQWARNTMVIAGLLSSTSPRGIWEITEKGKKFYQQNKSNPTSINETVQFATKNNKDVEP